MNISKQELAACLDHALVRPNTTDEDVRSGCEIARRYGVAIVSVMPSHVELTASLLRGARVRTGVSVGFPHGSTSTAVKVYEAQEALQHGAREIDMVMNIAAFLSGRHDDVERDIAAVRKAAGHDVTLKVIIEVGYLTMEQIVQACRLVEAADADFVKTSTGFAPSGPTPEIVRLMRRSVGPRVQVKAAQGIRTYEHAIAMLEAGATRLGLTAVEAVMGGWEACHKAG